MSESPRRSPITVPLRNDFIYRLWFQLHQQHCMKYIYMYIQFGVHPIMSKRPTDQCHRTKASRRRAHRCPRWSHKTTHKHTTIQLKMARTWSCDRISVRRSQCGARARVAQSLRHLSCVCVCVCWLTYYPTCIYVYMMRATYMYIFTYIGARMEAASIEQIQKKKRCHFE